VKSVGRGDPIGHGTCAASVACSSKMGIMTRGTLIFMKVGDLTVANIAYALSETIVDINTEKRWGRSVVNIGIGKSIVYRMTFVHANIFYSCASQR
jgi:hypothetical protein